MIYPVIQVFVHIVDILLVIHLYVVIFHQHLLQDNGILLLVHQMVVYIVRKVPSTYIYNVSNDGEGEHKISFEILCCRIFGRSQMSLKSSKTIKVSLIKFYRIFKSFLTIYHPKLCNWCFY